jgi:hypothetical protein
MSEEFVPSVNLGNAALARRDVFVSVAATTSLFIPESAALAQTNSQDNEALARMAGLATASGLDALAALGPEQAVAYLAEETREGLFAWREGNYGLRAAGDPLKGLYVPAKQDLSATTGCWVRVWDGITGRPEWFGARTGDPDFDCLAALEACVALCQTVRLGPFDYYIRSSWQMGRTGRNILGSAGSGSTVGYGGDPAAPMGTADGTRIILTGARVADATIFIFGGNAGARDDLSIMRNSHLRDIKFARDCRTIRPRPSLSEDPLHCVKGVELRYFSDCSVSGIRSFDSPVGFHCYGIVYSRIRECMARRVTPATSRKRDFWVGWLVGGYGAANYGYIGANASVYFEHCSVFDAPGNFDTSIGLKLYGRIADSFFHQFEMARLDYGVVIDGSDENGIKMSNGAYKYAHQDVTFVNAVLDGYSKGGFVIRNLQDYNCLDIVTPYSSGGGAALEISDAAGQVTISGGKFISGGVRVRNVNGFTLMGTLIRDAAVPVELINAGMFNLQPSIFNLDTKAAAGCVLRNAFRGRLSPQIRGAPAMLDHGVVMDSETDHVTVDESAIDPGAFTTVDATRKVRFANGDAHGNAGTNVLVGAAG